MQKLLGLFEAHVEKGVLALCAGFALYVAWGYLLGSPNKITFGGKELGPGELHTAINDEAKRLDTAIRTAEADTEQTSVEAFQQELKKRFETGIFARSEDTQPVPAQLPVTTVFGSKIEVPGLEQEEESVELVTPLQPKSLAVGVGRSMIYRQPLLVGLGGEADELVDDEAKPVEQPWVTVGAYFDRKAQYQEMIKAGYAPYRARVYVVGVDVRRQEVQSDGTFAEPEVVSRGEAMPVVEVPEPIFDDEDGSLANKSEIDDAFRVIKAQQPLLQQPPFYLVDAGDFWDVPPLDGLEVEEEAEEDQEEETPMAPTRAAAPPGGGMAPGGMAPGSGTPRRGRPGAGGPTFGNPSGRSSTARTEAQQRQQERREIKQNLERAQQALVAKDFRQAIDLARGVASRESVTGSDRKKAEALIRRAEQLEQRAMRFAGGGGGLPARETLLTEIIEEPETGAPAVWFHDDTVESGKTYRYSMRVQLWNRYVGQTRSMKDPADARNPILVGEWSEWGTPVTVTPETHFFVAGPKPGDEAEAMVEVWKWRNGNWVKERFDVRVGDVVGGVKTVKTNELDEELKQVRADVDFTTGAVVLDLRLDEKVQQRIPGKGDFSYREQDSVVIVYLDPADGQVKEKSAVLDRNDPLRKKLEDAEL